MLVLEEQTVLVSISELKRNRKMKLQIVKLSETHEVKLNKALWPFSLKCIDSEAWLGSAPGHQQLAEDVQGQAAASTLTPLTSSQPLPL